MEVLKLTHKILEHIFIYPMNNNESTVHCLQIFLLKSTIHIQIHCVFYIKCFMLPINLSSMNNNTDMTPFLPSSLRLWAALVISLAPPCSWLFNLLPRYIILMILLRRSQVSWRSINVVISFYLLYDHQCNALSSTALILTFFAIYHIL